MKLLAVAALVLILAGCGGSEEPEAKAAAQSEPTPEFNESEVIGRWETDRDFDSTIVIYKDGDELRMNERFDDGSDLDSLLYESVENGETRYAADYGRDIGEYYVIGEDGQLQMWSDNGNYYTAPIDD